MPNITRISLPPGMFRKVTLAKKLNQNVCFLFNISQIRTQAADFYQNWLDGIAFEVKLIESIKDVKDT